MYHQSKSKGNGKRYRAILLLAANGPIPENILLDTNQELVDKAIEETKPHVKRTAGKYFKMVKQLCVCFDDKGNGLLSFAIVAFPSIEPFWPDWVPKGMVKNIFH